jgi:DnaK suppressor protein
MICMSTLTENQLASLTAALKARKVRLMEDIRRVLARSGREHYADLLGVTHDAGDESVASLLRDIANAEVVRDIGEVRDIVGAEERIAAGRYGICIDCSEAIGFDRLKAYPSAKRCLRCQQQREKTRAPSKYTGR